MENSEGILIAQCPLPYVERVWTTWPVCVKPLRRRQGATPADWFSFLLEEADGWW